MSILVTRRTSNWKKKINGLSIFTRRTNELMTGQYLEIIIDENLTSHANECFEKLIRRPENECFEKLTSED